MRREQTKQILKLRLSSRQAARGKDIHLDETLTLAYRPKGGDYRSRDVWEPQGRGLRAWAGSVSRDSNRIVVLKGLLCGSDGHTALGEMLVAYVKSNMRW
jgi:hypothetical protein